MKRNKNGWQRLEATVSAPSGKGLESDGQAACCCVPRRWLHGARPDRPGFGRRLVGPGREIGISLPTVQR